VDRDGVIRRANNAMRQLAGGDAPPLVGQHLGTALFAEPAGVAEIVAAARAGRRTGGIVRRSAKGRILRVSASPLANPGPEAAAVIVVEDVTEQKALEGQLLQSEKLASVGTMVSGVAHELNNPLTSIAGLSEFLLEQGKTDDASREHLRVINDQAERASRIVRNLLSFARKSPAELVPLDLADVAQRTVQLMGYELRRNGITVNTALGDSLPPVMGNRDQLQQVMLNLLTNASYAVSACPEGDARHIDVSVALVGDKVVLRVTDSGVGIKAEAMAQIFDPFFTTKPPGEGTGLGLFLSFGIADSHGGSLSAESSGRGATFTLALPAARGAFPAAATPQAAARHAAGRPRRILVVDDDPAVRRLVSVLFAHDGHTVDQAADGHDGLRQALAGHYDLVIGDRRAAVGAEPFLTALLRARPAWRPRIILAATERASGSAGAGATETDVKLLRKPFNLRDLRTAASDVWEASD